MDITLVESIETKAAEICKHPLKPDQPIWSTRLLDSLGRMELAFYISDLTGIELEAEDVCQENFESIQHIIKFLDRKGGLAR